MTLFSDGRSPPLRSLGTKVFSPLTHHWQPSNVSLSPSPALACRRRHLSHVAVALLSASPFTTSFCRRRFCLSTPSPLREICVSLSHRLLAQSSAVPPPPPMLQAWHSSATVAVRPTLRPFVTKVFSPLTLHWHPSNVSLSLSPSLVCRRRHLSHVAVALQSASPSTTLFCRRRTRFGESSNLCLLFPSSMAHAGVTTVRCFSPPPSFEIGNLASGLVSAPSSPCSSSNGCRATVKPLPFFPLR